MVTVTQHIKQKHVPGNEEVKEDIQELLRK